jgi:hypothetical protein
MVAKRPFLGAPARITLKKARKNGVFLVRSSLHHGAHPVSLKSSEENVPKHLLRKMFDGDSASGTGTRRAAGATTDKPYGRIKGELWRIRE